MTTDLELARQQWRDGNRRLEDARGDRERYRQLAENTDRVVDALRRRLGQSFTLDELAAAYGGADDWVLELLEDADPEGGVPLEPGTSADAAFHAYARGAVDYRP
jgi:DNA-directed RNA polymerase specialized sigma subunit